MMKNYVTAYLDDCHDSVKMVNEACKQYNRTSKTHHLSCLGYSNVTDFLKDYRANPNRFDNILLDIRLEENRTGWKVFEEIISEKSDASVIMYGGDVDPQDELPAMMSKENFSVSSWIERIEKLEPKSNIMQVFIRMGEMTGTVNHER
jgi:hypothetical protein